MSTSGSDGRAQAPSGARARRESKWVLRDHLRARGASQGASSGKRVVHDPRAWGRVPDHDSAFHVDAGGYASRGWLDYKAAAQFNYGSL